MGKSTTIINIQNKKKYFVSSVPRQAKVIVNNKKELTEFESGIFPSPLAKPLIMFHTLQGSAINMDPLHDLVVDIATNENIQDLVSDDKKIGPIMLKKNYLTYTQDIFSIFRLSKIRHVFIYYKGKDE